MSNLGKYQDIVTAAARNGGVDNLIKIIEDNAVAKTAPRIFVKGAGAATALIAIGVLAVKHFSDKNRAREVRANEAKEQLKAGTGGPTNLDDANAEHGEDANDSDSGNPG